MKINVIPNGFEKYMAFFLGKNLVFIDSMQFMNSSLDKLFKNLSDEDFKYCKKIADKYDTKVGDVKKLIPNLKNKNKYAFHYRNLKLYLFLGMKLIKIHRILKFKQPNWMKKYIDFITEKRKNATNNFEKDFFKLMINSVYGNQWKI